MCLIAIVIILSIDNRLANDPIEYLVNSVLKKLYTIRDKFTGIKKLNILFISYGLYPCNIGGVEIFNYHLIQSLNKKGHKTFVITTCNKKIGLKSDVYVVKESKFLPRKISVPLISLIKIYKLRKTIDLIHAPYTGPAWIYGFFLPLCKNIFKIPYVLMIHGGGMYEWGIKVVRDSLFKNSSALIGVSETIKREYEKRTKKDVILIHNLIPKNKTKKSKKDLKNEYNYNDSFIILFLGSIKKIKGIDILIKAFIGLGTKYVREKNLKLIIVGEGSLKIIMKKKVEASGFGDYIRFIGFVEERVKYEYLKLSDVFVIPSRFEAQSLSFLDALSHGLPIIGSDTKGINNIISDWVNGLLFPIGDAHSLKSKLKLVVENKDLRLKLSKNSEAYYRENFNYSTWLTQMTNIYRTVLKNREN